jgi:hypothetical protein
VRLACVKINGVDEPPALIIEHDTVEYSTGGITIEAGLLRFVRETNDRAVELLRPGQRHRNRDAECAEWLTTFLASGPDCARPVREVRGLGLAVGFGWQTLRRAAIELRIERVRVSWNGGGEWLWTLPDEHPSRVSEPEPVQ